MRRNELLKVYGMMRAGNYEQLDILRSGRGIQNAVKYRTNQKILETIEQSHSRHEHNGRQYLPPVRNA